MNVGAYRGSRPEFYDRAPISRTQYYYGGGLAPHAPTTRWTYTVPTGKRAWCDAMGANLVRGGAASANAYVQSYVQYQPSGGSGATVSQAYMLSNVLYNREYAQLAPFGLMQPGDILAAGTYNGDTGGNVSHEVWAKITEFDS